ncbi:MarR family winged helix-turn-helix transcriptional regulator [Ruania zhangjianzhongii]|uniref:MarR family winged helix-turn-helix transcriptional regulator n=1 Tax=Ruania zhangjianzhongii TaxID=2603206 RepID=UPI00143D5C9A|nr:MarR family winged helix-turn-helix transcriptional regulator [Ruania zhangjianzhongii]
MAHRSASGSDRSPHPGRSLAGQLQHLDALRRAMARRHSLNPADMRLLWLLSDDRARTFREISEELNLEQSTVNRQVNSAARANLVQISDDQPARLVLATKEGIAAFDQDVDRSLNGYRQALERMGTEHTAEFNALLAEFIEAYRDIVQPDEEP